MTLRAIYTSSDPDEAVNTSPTEGKKAIPIDRDEVLVRLNRARIRAQAGPETKTISVDRGPIPAQLSKLQKAADEVHTWLNLESIRLISERLRRVPRRAYTEERLPHVAVAAEQEDRDIQHTRELSPTAQLHRERVLTDRAADAHATGDSLLVGEESACLALEQLNVAFLGPAGTFTQTAALKHFGHSVTTTPFGTIGDVFREVEAGNCHFGIVPVENSIEGVVNHTLDMFMNSPLKICGEVELRIHHYLLASGGALSDIGRVYAHQQALAQCRRWLDYNLPHADRIAVNSNAEAAHRIVGEAGAAAIAGESAAELYGLCALASNIEDEAENTTRFLIVGHRNTPASGEDKTSLLFSIPNQPGALYHALEAFANHGVNMMRIASRPSRRGLWEYAFFVDAEGHAEEQAVAAALEELDSRASILKILGAYARAA